MASERILLPVVCDSMSLIGVDTSSLPVGWGNYFSLALAGEPNGLRICNFWWENLEAAKSRFLTDGKVHVQVWTEADGRKFGIIDDARIPEDWYYNKMCWTGYGRPSLETAREMYAVRKDPTNELEVFTDPHSYHKKRGGTYRSASEGISSMVLYNLPGTLPPTAE